VSSKYFQPSLIFLSKTGAFIAGLAYHGRLLTSPSRNKLAEKTLQLTFGRVSVTKKKRFRALNTQDDNVVKNQNLE
jgi:hypothetical protein